MNVIEQDAVSEVQAPIEEATPEQEVVTPEQKPSKPIVSDEVQQQNWRAARSKLEEQQHQIWLLQQELESVRKQAPKQEEDTEEEQFTESERKLYREIKSLKTEISRSRVKQSETDADRLRSKFSDFDEVMHPENIEYLRANNPSLAKALTSLKDEPYEQGLAAYEALRNTSWYRDRNMNQEEKVKLEQNKKKPLSVQAVRKEGALNDANRFANGLTPELKKALLKEMSEARKGS